MLDFSTVNRNYWVIQGMLILKATVKLHSKMAMKLYIINIMYDFPTAPHPHQDMAFSRLRHCNCCAIGSPCFNMCFPNG